MSHEASHRLENDTRWVAGVYPSRRKDRDAWVESLRGARHEIDDSRPAGILLEDEPAGGDGGRIRRVDRCLTVFLTGRECPWRCVFCDLWRHTLERTVRPGVIVRQLEAALRDPRVIAERPSTLKLYNAGSFFDAGAIPPEDDAGLAGYCAPFDRVVVESHPALVGDRCWRFRDRLASREGVGGGRLEVAMGLETVEPGVLELLNKGVTLEDVDRASVRLRAEGIDWRAFVLVQPPMGDPERSVEWAVASASWAWDRGARLVSLIPVRGGNGALEALARVGRFRQPTLDVLEKAMDGALSLGRGCVQADMWDLERFSGCSACYPRRFERLKRLNLRQEDREDSACDVCGWRREAGLTPLE